MCLGVKQFALQRTIAHRVSVPQALPLHVSKRAATGCLCLGHGAGSHCNDVCGFLRGFVKERQTLPLYMSKLARRRLIRQPLAV